MEASLLLLVILLAWIWLLSQWWTNLADVSFLVFAVVAVIGFISVFYLVSRVRTELRYELGNGYSTAGFINSDFPSPDVSDKIALVNPFSGVIICAYSYLDFAPISWETRWYSECLLRETEKLDATSTTKIFTIELMHFDSGATDPFYDTFSIRSSQPHQWALSIPGKQPRRPLRRAEMLISQLPELPDEAVGKPSPTFRFGLLLRGLAAKANNDQSL